MRFGQNEGKAGSSLQGCGAEIRELLQAVHVPVRGRLGMRHAAGGYRLGIPSNPQLLRARFLRERARCHYGRAAVGGAWPGGNVRGAQPVPVLHFLLGSHHGRPHGGAHAHGLVPAVSAPELLVLRPQQHRRDDVEAGNRPVRYFRGGPSRPREPVHRYAEDCGLVRSADVHQRAAYVGDAGGDGRYGNVRIRGELSQAHHLPPEPRAHGGPQCAPAGFAGRHPRGEGLRQRAYRDRQVRPRQRGVHRNEGALVPLYGAVPDGFELLHGRAVHGHYRGRRVVRGAGHPRAGRHGYVCALHRHIHRAG